MYKCPIKKDISLRPENFMEAVYYNAENVLFNLVFVLTKFLQRIYRV